MPSLDRLPNEVLHSIASFLHKKYDLAAFSRANRHCYDIASPILWKREARSDRPGALHWAVEHEDVRVLRRALKAGVSPSRLAYTHRPKPRIDPAHKWYNYHSSYYDDPMWRVQDDDQSVDLDASYVLHDTCGCFESGCDDGIFSDCRWEAIHVAASKGRIDMIEILLDAGASIEAPSWGVCLCRPHLPIAAFSESQAVDEEELEDLHGGNWTPLHVAICHGKYDTAKFLLKRGASTVIYQGIDFELDPTAWRDDDVAHDSSRFRLTALHHAAKHNMLDLLRLLVEEGYQQDINVEGPFMGTPLFQAIWYGHWDTIVPYLLEQGADIDRRLIETRLTPLMMACFSRRFDDASKLIDLGADVTTLSVHRFSILHLILGPRQLRPEDFFDPTGPPPKPPNKISEAEIIEKFLAKGFDVNAREALLGMTPLMVASASCNTDAMQALLDGGANVNALDHDGLTALARVGEAAEGSAILGLYDAAKMLLDAGATMKDSMEEVTPLNIICSRRCEPYFSRDWDNQHAALAKLLIERGADPNEKGVSVSRPFTEAIVHGNLSLAEAILENGGRPEQGDLENLLSTSVYDPYDDGKTEFILLIDYAKYGMSGPSDAFLVRLLKTALDNQLWTRAADLMKSVPTPRELRKGLIYRCLESHSPTSDEPSGLIQVLLDRGEDPNELFNGEPPLYYSFRSGSCWRTTPVLVNGGADVHMPTKAMPDGAFMYTITHGYQPQTLQILAKHPHALRDKPERLHRECWTSLIFRQPNIDSRKRGRQSNGSVPQLNWTFTSRLISAGLRTDVKTLDDTDVKELVEQAIPKSEVLRVEGRKVLEALDIPYVEPTGSDIIENIIRDTCANDSESDAFDEDFDYASVSDEIDDHSDYSDLDSDGYGGLDFFPPFMGGEEDEDEDDEDEQDDQEGNGGWNDDDHSSDFDDYEDNAPMPIPVPLLFGLLM
ncbi:hypothetical protein FSARC_8686 [Fusarium sarcochroum]|uniref:F-box domain-containing protein n=1 Tax=Fusarium sarcochroum TaxID=1208366 RepID=A0A8H4TSW4_9HYPO|nr:hypothetical protein FSARC_8686 [Fusarium sarcochroum]